MLILLGIRMRLPWRMGAFVSLPSLFYLSFVFLGFVLAFGGLLFQFQLALKKIEQEQIIKTLLTEMEARTQAQQDAFVSTRTKSRFLANMSHELRTPLNIIVGFSEILIDDPEEPLTERSQSYAENIRQSSLHLLSLINDILDLAKVDSEEISLHREEVRATTWFEQIHASVLPLAQKKQLKVTLSLKELPETINIDPKKSRQVVLNLLSNAIKFCAPKGHVALSVWTDKDDLCIEVKDDGIGLKWEDQERIFNEFEQVDDSLSRQHEGTGLGLSLARRLAELHGGTVEVFSEGLGMGSTFTALLSLVPSESELPAEALEE